MKNIDYSENIVKSIKLLFKNLKLFIPDIIFLVFSWLTIIIFVFFNFGESIQAILKVLSNDAATDSISNIFQTLINSKNFFIKLAVTGFIWIVANVVVGIGTKSMRYSLIRATIKGEKLNLKKASKEARGYLMPIFKIVIVLYLISIIPLAFAGVVAAGLTILSKVVGIPLIILFIFLGLAYMIFIKIAFLFVYPVLILKTKKGAIKTLKQAYQYYKQNKKKSLIVFLIVVGINLAVGAAGYGVYGGGLSLGVFYFVFIFLAFIIRIFLNIAVRLWSDLFIFKNF